MFSEIRKTLTARQLRFSSVALLLVLIGIVSALLPVQLSANTNAEYAGVPPFIESAVVPNVLFLMDNSGSMVLRGDCPNDPVCPNWDETKTYLGMFDSLQCYFYNSVDGRFEPQVAKTSIADNVTCGTTMWDGNFLNWITFRRMDAIKKAMTGGSCAVMRAADGSCPPSGGTPMVTLKGEDSDLTSVAGDLATPMVQQGAGVNRLDGRVPDAVQIGSLAMKNNLVFYLRGTGPLTGSFCVWKTGGMGPAVGANTCDDGAGGFTEQQYVIHVAVPLSPLGVLQKIGSKARLGLMEFRDVGGVDGGKVLVPIGWRQFVPFQNGVQPISTFTTNVAAMLQGIDSTKPATWTPLGEALYTAGRYIAQLAQPYTATYTYPIAFSPDGVAFNTVGKGSPKGTTGDNELSALSVGDPTCAAISATYNIVNACGRDPYLFASNSSPVWASPPSVVNCCKTFVIIFTDGEPTQDTNVPAGLQDYAHSVHGTHCTLTTNNITNPPPRANPTNRCYTGFRTFNPPGVGQISSSGEAQLLLNQHKTDYGSSGTHYLDDVAYWMHINDMRPDNGNSDPAQACSGGVPNIAVLNVVGRCLPGFQNVTVYTFYSFGTINGRELLMQTARQGGFTDQNGNRVPDLTTEYDRVNNYTGSLGSDGIPDTYYESSNIDDMQDKLLAALASIIQKAASGTSVSVLATSSTGEGAIYQSYFFPSRLNGVQEVTWTGYSQSLFVDRYGNLREDFSSTSGCLAAIGSSPPDGKLVLTHDCIVRFRFDVPTNQVLVDRFVDVNGDGIADSLTPSMTIAITDVQPIWEAGRRLALLNSGDSCPQDNGGSTCRRILTWIDISNAGGVGPSPEEFNEFRPDRKNWLCPYLDGTLVLDCTSGDPTAQANALAEAENIIRFVRGEQIAGMRDRMLQFKDDTNTDVTRVWKLGDIMHSTPSIVAAPRERYDILYGDPSYSDFYKRYKNRRQVMYVGGNDGMLHAFNGGFFYLGDDPATLTVVEEAQFSATPIGAVPFATRSDTPPLGGELWAFIPQDLLPQLKWLTSPAYDHVYFVDLKPKVTDARIFDPADPDHPGGWGTILIGGFRLGGSCTHCNKGKAAPRIVTADFNYDGDVTDTGNGVNGENSDTRVFLSSYFVMDITNPEKDPVLLWTFKDKDLGLTTSYPAIIRMNPSGDTMTNATNEKWYVVFGSGPTHHDGSAVNDGPVPGPSVIQYAKMFVIDLANGPTYSEINVTAGGSCSLTSPCVTAARYNANVKNITVFSTGLPGAFMGDVMTWDFNLDFRVDVLYAGSSQCNPNGLPSAVYSPCNGSNPAYRGAMWRLSTNHGDPDPDTWGILNAPTTLLSQFTSMVGAAHCAGSSCRPGPILAAPEVTSDEVNNYWVYFGSGRYFTNNDKLNADQQYYMGVKDCSLSSNCLESAEPRNLYDVTSIVLCIGTTGGCTATGNVSTNGGTTYPTSFDQGGGSLVNTVQNMDGWFMLFQLPEPDPDPNPYIANDAITRERALSRPVIIGGTVFFTTYVPTAQMCLSSGNGYLYALYYLTGTAYKDPSLGSTNLGSYTTSTRFVDLGYGMPSGVTVQMGATGFGVDGAATSGIGCASGITTFIQSSSSAINQRCVRPAPSLYGSPWSKLMTWRDL
jgi:type IV pilus assembly protein PilY1